MKIWDIRKQTSLSYDKHEGKIWALDVFKDETRNNKVEVMTGGNDSILYVWKDSTEDTRDKIIKTHELEQQERIEIDQLLYDGKFVDAAILAFENNYTQLFIKTVNRFFTTFHESQNGNEVTFEDGKLMIAEDE